MKTRLEKAFPVPVPADTAWALLQDIEAVAGCMPGARITERVDATHYKGTVAVRLGPASLSFRGEVEVRALDAEARTLQLFAKGTDTTGSSGASMDLTARVEPVDAASCRLAGISEVSMSGKAATFGARLVQPMAEQILAQFAANFAARAQALQPAAAAPEAAPEAVAPLNGLALVWAMLRDWFRSLGGARKT